ncbi:hypothetical protein H2200_000520 [Cladophialophora chaetospira]|uniref:Heterokaryon incompatibility domain-containing protein n=1 Tax=Cladophialophora chaetospira TaxID=386627 RepID=A0AA38XNY2_9EURO|nr:hypothetical protein H2200_000520 [Cladophialophora chaetospira]
MCNITNKNDYLPTRLIDAHPGLHNDAVRLVASTDIQDNHMKYAALSHSWGPKSQRIKPIPKTTKQSITDRMNHISFDELTRTFQDAVIVARRLDIRYIWIDSLCIVQHDEEDFVEQVRNMLKVYGEAHLVISALRAATGDMGLFHERPATLRISQDDGWGNTVTACVRPGAQHEDFFTASPRSFAVAPLFARAWCFQERLAARRLIHFSESEIVYECNRNLVCECNSSAVPIDLETSGNFRRRQALALQKATVESRLNTWYDVLRPYTFRSLTVESDRLPALSGFAQRVALPELGRYCAGFWESELPVALLWRILRPLPENGDLIKRPNEYQAPSWAWPSVQAVIEPYMRFDKRTQIVAEVLEFVCEPATSDPYGKVKS